MFVIYNGNGPTYVSSNCLEMLQNLLASTFNAN